jgi:type IV pilus assembly protein PilB
MREEIREAVLLGASALEIKRKAVSLGMQTLRAAGLRKVREGVTTVDEVVRVTISD